MTFNNVTTHDSVPPFRVTRKKTLQDVIEFNAQNGMSEVRPGNQKKYRILGEEKGGIVPNIYILQT